MTYIRCKKEIWKGFLKLSTHYTKLTSDESQELIFLLREEVELLEFLYEVLSHRSRNSVKSMLGRGQVVVDHRVETQFNYCVQKGQKVVITKNEAAKRRNLLQGVSIIYEDQELLVVEKAEGLLSVATETERDMTAFHQILAYERSKNRRNQVFVVHRLDRDTSGLMIFAKKKNVQKTLQNSWHSLVDRRIYSAVVEGEIQKNKATLSSWLKENKEHIVYSSDKEGDGQHAVTHYEVVQKNTDFTLLDVRLETGRKNQIRVHMKDIGHPVVGDEKYGSKRLKTMGRLGLHAKELGFTHPVKKRYMQFTSKPPTIFLRLSEKR